MNVGIPEQEQTIMYRWVLRTNGRQNDQKTKI